MSVTEIVTILKANWPTIVTLLGSGSGVAVVLQAIKHFGKLEDAKKFVMFLLGLLSTAAALADAVLQHKTGTALGVDLGWVVTAAVFVHRFAVSPGYYKLTNFFEGVYKDAQTYRSETLVQPVTPIDQLDAALAAASPHEFTLAN